MIDLSPATLAWVWFLSIVAMFLCLGLAALRRGR